MKQKLIKATAIVFALTILGSFAPAEAAPKQAAEFSLRMGGAQRAAEDSKPNACWSASMDYFFYKTYMLGFSFGYNRQARKIQTETVKGYGDVLIYVGDKELWKNKYAGTTLSAKLGFISPVSEDSRHTSQIWGVQESGTLKKVFTDRWNISYTLEATQFGYEYDTVDPEVTEDKEVYNTLFKVTNRASTTFDLIKDLHWVTSAWVHTYENTRDQSTEIRGVSTKLNYEMTKMTAIDFGVSSSWKNAGPDVWDGPLYSKKPFERDGVLVTFGTTIKI